MKELIEPPMDNKIAAIAEGRCSCSPTPKEQAIKTLNGLKHEFLVARIAVEGTLKFLENGFADFEAQIRADERAKTKAACAGIAEAATHEWNQYHDLDGQFIYGFEKAQDNIATAIEAWEPNNDTA